MLRLIKNRIAVKISLTLVVCLILIFGLLCWYLITSRKEVLERELFSKGRMAALAGAQAMEHLLEIMIESGTFSVEEMFDENYQLITEGPLAGTAIPKYHTVYDRYLDGKIQHLEDSFLSDSMVVYAVLVDRNGFLPTHNIRYSKPLTGDPEQDRIGNRTKRIFNDPVGLAAARSGQADSATILKQIYFRDTGVRMWDLSAPVFVRGQHWGAFRIGFSMEETEAGIRQLRETILLASFASLTVCALLIIYLVSRFVAPLQQLKRSAQAIAKGGTQEKIDLVSSDEVGELVEAFNQMNDALELTTVSRDYYDMLLHSMHDLLIVADHHWRITSANRATCEVLGYMEADLLGKSVKKLVKLSDENQVWFTQRMVVMNNYTADVTLLTKADEAVPMAMSCSPLISADQQLSGFILSFQDNRERIQAEQAMEEALGQAVNLNDELQAKNRELDKAYSQLKNSQLQVLQQEKMASIGQLAAGVAHEINNPMGFITSNLGTLNKYFVRLKTFLDHQQQIIEGKAPLVDQHVIQEQREKLKIDFMLPDINDLIEESQQGALRVTEIVKNLKTFSRVDQASEHDVDINQCLENTINIAWNELKYKVTLEKNFGSLPLLRCYPQKLNQVFLNLLLNAAQAIDDKGLIEVKTWSERGNICVAIRDTGCGIPEENLGRIFEPFFTTKEVGKGTGLGMSISYDIISEHGGKIKVASRVGQGTTFIIELPFGGEEKSDG